mmetsp:Transcript_24884/g.40298  ORF Transcript_24884/g.40298 Transcript_24884/m.40298 type:complete len:498 (-) Transcript_24884:276-1769(-)
MHDMNILYIEIGGKHWYSLLEHIVGHMIRHLWIRHDKHSLRIKLSRFLHRHCAQIWSRILGRIVQNHIVEWLQNIHNEFRIGFGMIARHPYQRDMNIQIIRVDHVRNEWRNTCARRQHKHAIPIEQSLREVRRLNATHIERSVVEQAGYFGALIQRRRPIAQRLHEHKTAVTVLLIVRQWRNAHHVKLDKVSRQFAHCTHRRPPREYKRRRASRRQNLHIAPFNAMHNHPRIHGQHRNENGQHRRRVLECLAHRVGVVQIDQHHVHNQQRQCQPTQIAMQNLKRVMKVMPKTRQRRHTNHHQQQWEGPRRATAQVHFIAFTNKCANRVDNVPYQGGDTHGRVQSADTICQTRNVISSIFSATKVHGLFHRPINAPQEDLVTHQRRQKHRPNSKKTNLRQRNFRLWIVVRRVPDTKEYDIGEQHRNLPQPVVQVDAHRIRFKATHGRNIKNQCATNLIRQLDCVQLRLRLLLAFRARSLLRQCSWRQCHFLIFRHRRW